MAIVYTNNAPQVQLTCPYCGQKQYVDLRKYEIEEDAYENEERSMGKEMTHSICIQAKCHNKHCNKEINVEICVFEYPINSINSITCEPEQAFNTDELKSCFKIDFGNEDEG